MKMAVKNLFEFFQILSNDRQLHDEVDGARVVLGDEASNQKKFCSC